MHHIFRTLSKAAPARRAHIPKIRRWLWKNMPCATAHLATKHVPCHPSSLAFCKSDPEGRPSNCPRDTSKVQTRYTDQESNAAHVYGWDSLQAFNYPVSCCSSSGPLFLRLAKQSPSLSYHVCHSTWLWLKIRDPNMYGFLLASPSNKDKPI